MSKKILLSVVLVLVCTVCIAGCTGPFVEAYNVPMIDLDGGVIMAGGVPENDTLYTFDSAALDKYAEMFAHKTIVADKDDFGKDYMAHPDSILLRRKKAGTDTFEFTEEVLTVFPLAHGKGPLKAKISTDGGLTYPMEGTLQNTPKSWERSQETPTIYRLTFTPDNKPSDDDMLVMVSGCPYWAKSQDFPELPRNGFNVSLSSPSIDEATGDSVEGREWTEFETWYGHGKDAGNENTVVRNPLGKNAHDCIVAMSALTRLKDPVTHEWKNEWMGLFHDRKHDCYKTILSFREPEAGNTYPTYKVCGKDMVMEWSEPVKYFDNYSSIEHKSKMCEVECIRSDRGEGNKLAIITRSNAKNMNSLISFSEDEGATWSEPKEVPFALSGERHKAEWVKDNKGNDKLFITFRSIERSSDKRSKYKKSKWMSEGYVAWLGSWDDLEKGSEGDFRVKIAHTYHDGQNEIDRDAHADTGYCGNVVLPNGKVATCSYGRFSPANDPMRGGTTYIAGRVIDVAGLYDLITLAK